jgi:hypothetical protein
MARKKGLAAFKKRRRGRKKKANPPAKKANPPLLKDATEVILPGFASYAGTRLLARIVYTIIQKKYPKAGKHAAAGASVAAFAAVWFGAHRIKRLEKYHDGMVMGSAIATIGTLVRTYLSKYGWIIADYRPEDVKALPAQAPAALPEPELDDEDEFSWLEGETEVAQSRAAAAQAEVDEVEDDDFMAAPDDDDDYASMLN